MRNCRYRSCGTANGIADADDPCADVPARPHAGGLFSAMAVTSEKQLRIAGHGVADRWSVLTANISVRLCVDLHQVGQLYVDADVSACRS
jgi:hypothetical protein